MADIKTRARALCHRLNAPDCTCQDVTKCDSGMAIMEALSAPQPRVGREELREAIRRKLISAYGHAFAPVVDSLTDMALPASAGEGWQDIETKPPDPVQVEFYFGKMVLRDQYDNPVTLPAYRDERRCLGYWDGSDWRYCGTGHPVFEFDGTLGEQLPTHWRPLPAPPSEGKP